MRTQINYTNDKTYGMESSEELYMATIFERFNKDIGIVFNFPRPAKGMNEKSEIDRVEIMFTRDEAEEIIAVLQSYLHHPKNKDSEEGWVTFRNMPRIYKQEVLEQIDCSWTEGFYPKFFTINKYANQ